MNKLHILSLLMLVAALPACGKKCKERCHNKETIVIVPADSAVTVK